VKVIAVLGISGVGKSSLIRLAASHISLLHLTASSLIKAQLAQAPTSEQLRAGPVIDNQELMLREFARQIATPEQPLIIFDGHNLIDTATGLLEIPRAVFAELRLNAIIFIEDAPDQIHARRLADKMRERPGRSVAELGEQQSRAIEYAIGLAGGLEIPFHSIQSGDVQGLLAVLAGN
jgi:adenylate kinase